MMNTTEMKSTSEIDAADAIAEAIYIARFIQGMTVNLPPDHALTLQPSQLSGLYYTMQGMIERMEKTKALFDHRSEK
jgi:hypothetical protein